jgi:hypothetical protein
MLVIVTAGCATAPVPSEQMSASQASIRAAEEVGLQSVPSAALHLQLAKEEVQHAKQLIADNENERARFMLLRAETDAELALAESREYSAKEEAQQALREAQAQEQRADSQ